MTAYWSGQRGSNPSLQLGRLRHNPYTIPAFLCNVNVGGPSGTRTHIWRFRDAFITFMIQNQILQVSFCCLTYHWSIYAKAWNRIRTCNRTIMFIAETNLNWCCQEESNLHFIRTKDVYYHQTIAALFVFVSYLVVNSINIALFDLVDIRLLIAKPKLTITVNGNKIDQIFFSITSFLLVPRERLELSACGF